LVYEKSNIHPTLVSTNIYKINNREVKTWNFSWFSTKLIYGMLIFSALPCVGENGVG
jgi:hypothetical protein